MEAAIVIFMVGFAVGALALGLSVAFMLRKGDRDVPGAIRKIVPALVAVLVGVMLFAPQMSTLAQDPTPVQLDIPIDTVFASTNDWMTTFAPIAAIGIGITIALAVFGYLGKAISSAFH